MPGSGHAPAPGSCVFPVRSADRVESQRQVARAACHGAHHRQVDRQSRRPIPRARLESRGAYQVQAGLVAVHAAKMRRNADGSGKIAAERQTSQTRRHCRRAATRRPARGSREIPRIVGDPVDRIITLPVPQHHRHVGFSDHDRARGLQPFDRDSGPRTERVRKLRQAPCIGRVSISERFFYGDRHAVQRPPNLSLPERLVRQPRARHRLFACLPDNRVDLWIAGVHPLKRLVHQFGGRNALGSNCFG